MTMAPLRFMTVSVLRALVMHCTPSNRTLPRCLISMVDCTSARLTAPPMWNVRMVSWVPGSPMDWAAMTPTASPISTMLPVPRFRP